MDASEYQREAAKTARYPHLVQHGYDANGAPVDTTIRYIYPALGLAGEAGEAVEKIKKMVRDGRTEHLERALVAELGDVLWYVANIAREFEWDLSDIMEYNLEKLKDRMARGVIGGSGDAR